MRNRLLLAIAAMTAIALAVPALASATWTHKGQGELKENAPITLSSELSVSTEVGKVTCPTSIEATLTGESSSGTVNSYTVSEPSKCDLSESLGAVCGTHGVSKVQKAGSWELTAKEANIEISSLDLEFQLGKCLIPSLRIKGTATATPDKSFAMSTLALSGSQTLYNALEEEVGSANLTGTPSVSPAATYGVKTAPLVETAWLMESKHLSEDGEMTLSGPLSFSYSGGSVSCTASAVLGLTAGEVEEEEPEGEVEGFTVSSPSGCVAGGGLKTTCGEHPVKSVAKAGTWTLNADDDDISVSGLALDYQFKECAVTSLRLEGSATLSVEDPGAITTAAFGGKPAIYNSGEEKIGSAELSGSPGASPSGTFQLRPEPPLPSEPISIDSSEGFPAPFTLSGGSATLGGSEVITNCESVTGSGQLSTKKTGTVILTLHDCTEPVFESDCTSPDESNGTLVTSTLAFHLVTVNGDETPAVLLTTKDDEFVTYECLGGYIGVEVTGNGILGDIVAPSYNEFSSMIGLHFGAEGSEQELTKTSEGETEYRLQSAVNGGASEPLGLQTELTLSLTEGEVELTEEE